MTKAPHVAAARVRLDRASRREDWARFARLASTLLGLFRLRFTFDRGSGTDRGLAFQDHW